MKRLRRVNKARATPESLSDGSQHADGIVNELGFKCSEKRGIMIQYR